jgi:hypothetical protein
MYRFTVKMPKEEVEALEKIAEVELRDFRAQAALIIREELQRRGLLARQAGTIHQEKGKTNGNSKPC